MLLILTNRFAVGRIVRTPFKLFRMGGMGFIGSFPPVIEVESGRDQADGAGDKRILGLEKIESAQ